MFSFILINSFTILLYITTLSASLPTPMVLHGNYSTWFNRTINKDIEYILVFDKDVSENSSRIFVISDDATIDAPLMVVVRQQKEVLSWQVPLVVLSDSGKIEFNQTARTLCPANVAHNKYSYGVDTWEDPIVSISTASRNNISFSLVVYNKIQLFINASVEYSTVISPSEPSYYFYNFPANVTNNNWNFETVILEVNSDDDVCMTVSIQNASCPIFDLNHDITFQGYWETVTRKGGITVSKRNFPFGFFIVFVAKGDDSDCTGTTKMLTIDRNKNVRFIIKPSIAYDDYVMAVIITISCIVVSYLILIATFFWWSKKDYKPRAMEFVDENDTQTIHDVTTPSTATAADLLDNSSMDETEYDTIAEADFDREVILGKPVLYLSDLARKDPRVLKKKSYFYLWHVLTVALFYGLPVVQLVITIFFHFAIFIFVATAIAGLYAMSPQVLNDTGNQDLCYYNFLCAHPLGFISDFNHLFSNIGYISFGFLFVCMVYRREKLHNDATFERHFGIPQHYGLFYAMGVALIMEGVLSGSYHICPNHSNFQFDSSFMYVMAVLCMVKLYQTRHPDINATAYATFGVLAIAILLGMIGVLEANLYFWIAFTVLHIIVCLVLTAQVYYFGYWKLDRGLLRRVLHVFVHDFWAGSCSVLKPVHQGRMVLLVLGNLSNWALAVLGIYHHERDFATYLLAVFMCNTTLYFIFYIVMKLLHKERINLQAVMYLTLSLMCACSAMYFFYHKSISWALTPAQSRMFNQECKLLQFYDFHDIWHFLSAIGMFFTFMVLLTLDDDLSHTLRSKISVF